MPPALLLTLLTITCTFAWPWPGITLPGLQEEGLQELQVTPCCSKGEQLVIKELRRGGRKAECIQGADNEMDSKVWTTGGLRQLELLEAQTPRCSRGLRLVGISQNNTQQIVRLFANETIFLRGGSSADEGNVYINGSPVCDDSWDDTDARVVCRMLGYSAGRATQMSTFGSVPGGVYGMDEVQCRGDEKSLVDCPHDTTDDCTASEAAGVVCGSSGLGDSMARLSPEGDLQIGTEIPSGSVNETEVDQSAVEVSSLEQGEFCLSPGFRETASEREEEELVGLYCDTCKEQVLCSYAEEMFQGLDLYDNNKYITAGRPLTSSIVAVADTNEDAKLDFDEFHMKLKEYLQTAFDALDENKDGSIYDEAKHGKLFNKISFKFLDAALKEALNFFDSNKDNSVSLDDSPFYYVRRDRNKDDMKTLSDVFGTSLISLPAPIYNLYTNLDSNRDEKLADTEAQDFLLRIFSIIDKDLDCRISADEVVALLQRVGVRPDHQLAVRIILEQYLALGSYLLQAIVQEADVDKDTRVTMEEVVSFSNFQFMEEQQDVMVGLGEPGSAVNYLLGSQRYGYGYNREESEETVAMWLTALQNLLELQEFSKTVDPKSLGQC